MIEISRNDTQIIFKDGNAIIIFDNSCVRYKKPEAIKKALEGIAQIYINAFLKHNNTL